MSSTGRGPRLGGPDDVYETPGWAVHRLLEAWAPTGGLWVEPGAGNGAIIRAVAEKRDDVEWLAVEARATCREPLAATGARACIVDYLAEDPWGEDCDAAVAVLGNPPFHSAMAFVERSLKLFRRAHVAMLLRLAFLATAERNEFMRAHPPDVYVLPDRPSFIGGATDSADYGWFAWPPQLVLRDCGMLRVLRTTPRAERIAAKRTR